MDLYASGASIDEVARRFGVTAGTAMKHLADFIAQRRPAAIDRWVDAAMYAKVVEASRRSDDGRLKPIFEALGGAVPYDLIRVVVSHLKIRDEVAAKE